MKADCVRKKRVRMKRIQKDRNQTKSNGQTSASTTDNTEETRVHRHKHDTKQKMATEGRRERKVDRSGVNTKTNYKDYGER